MMTKWTREVPQMFVINIQCTVKLSKHATLKFSGCSQYTVDWYMDSSHNYLIISLINGGFCMQSV